MDFGSTRRHYLLITKFDDCENDRRAYRYKAEDDDLVYKFTKLFEDETVDEDGDMILIKTVDYSDEIIAAFRDVGLVSGTGAFPFDGRLTTGDIKVIEEIVKCPKCANLAEHSKLYQGDFEFVCKHGKEGKSAKLKVLGLDVKPVASEPVKTKEEGTNVKPVESEPVKPKEEGLDVKPVASEPVKPIYKGVDVKYFPSGTKNFWITERNYYHTTSDIVLTMEGKILGSNSCDLIYPLSHLQHEHWTNNGVTQFAQPQEDGTHISWFNLDGSLKTVPDKFILNPSIPPSPMYDQEYMYDWEHIYTN